MQYLSLLKMMFLILLIPQYLIAGWEITYRTNSPDGMISYDVMIAENGRIKYSGTDGGFIFNQKTGDFIWLMDDVKGYWQGDIETFRHELDQAMKDAMAEMLKNIPEQQRPMYEQMLSSMKSMYETPSSGEIENLDVSVSKTGNSSEIAGYSVEQYQIELDGVKVEEIWLAPEIKMEDEMDTRAMVEMFNQISPNVDNELLYMHSEPYLELWKKGFRMKSIDRHQEQVEVIKVVQRSIAKEEFEIPGGYQPVTSDQMMFQMMQSGTKDSGNDW